ncbi:DgyrCDS13483 [Dimorphilus gyrociliatus]|uniref:DgyrCDS13483 n=1 Tax=Dimorphilus gyrociliatus TaxID=2664684 RepID=A0A7I8WAT4_9ANNE|nr:DgyrCDS13483 [Dimorphilus gyrociliatus]
MIGKKRKASFQAEQPNLKRLRKVVESLAGESSSKTETFIVRESLRKKRRKEDRNLKKMRKNAHRRGDRLPTKKGLEIKREKEVRKKLRQKKKKLERKIEREKKAEEKRLAQEEKEQEEHEEMLREREIQMANKADDKIIRELEKKLHMTKKKGKKKIPQSFAAEGLDYLLDVLEGSGKDGDDAFTNEDSNSKNLDNSDQEELDESDEIMEEEFEGDSEDGGDEEGEEFEESDQESESEDILDEEEEKQEDEDDVDNVNDFQKKKKNINLSSKEKEIKDDSKNLMKEDIYGRTFDSSGQEVSKAYVPPALRTSSSEDMKVKRKIQGLVNRLGETNKLKISVEIEQVYRENSRAIVTEALTSSIISSCLQKSQVAQKSISDYIELLAIISSSIGFEISAMFLQTVAEKWIELCKDSDEEDKKLLNCTQIICALYNLKLLKSPLVLDLLGHICSSNQLFHVEVILIIVTQCGFILRKDDPIGLKNVINLVKEKSVQLIDENKGGYSRTEFMMDCLLAVRNNDVRKLPNYDEELIPNVLKAYKNILKQRNLLQANPLNVRLEDITEADKRGKWWLVGAAWTGDKSTKDVEKEKITKSKFR